MKVPQGLLILLVAFLMSPKDSGVCASQDISITPANPLIKLGSSLTLNCSVSCSPGKPRWTVMDSSSLMPEDHDQFTIMKIPDVTVDNSPFICQAKCGKKKPRTQVRLYYFSNLNISTDPVEPVSGQQFLLKCSVDVHRDVTVDLKLLREGTVIHTQTQCEDYEFKHCEFSAKESTESTQVHYQCEATLQVKTSQLSESASLRLHLKGPTISTDPPIKATPPTARPPSIEVPHTERAPVQTEHPHAQSTAAFKEAADESTNSPVEATSSTEEPESETEEAADESTNSPVEATSSTGAPELETEEAADESTNSPAEATSSTMAPESVTDAWSSGFSQTVMFLVFPVLVVLGVGLFYCWRKYKNQEKPMGEASPPECS